MGDISRAIENSRTNTRGGYRWCRAAMRLQSALTVFGQTYCYIAKRAVIGQKGIDVAREVGECTHTVPAWGVSKNLLRITIVVCSSGPPREPEVRTASGDGNRIWNISRAVQASLYDMCIR